MKIFFQGISGMLSIVPAWVWALLLAGSALHSCKLGHDVSVAKLDAQTQKSNASTAKTELSELKEKASQAVTEAVQAARAEELAKYTELQEKTNVLRRQRDDAVRDLAAASDRLRDPIRGAADAFASCADMPQGAPIAAGVENRARTQFQDSSRSLADRILQLAVESDEVVRERALCLSMRPDER